MPKRTSRSHKQYMKEVDAYKYFIVHIPTKKVMSGWEIMEDAKSEMKDNDYDRKEYKVLSEASLKSLGIKNPKAKWKEEYKDGGNVSDQLSKMEYWELQSKLKTLLKESESGNADSKTYEMISELGKEIARRDEGTLKEKRNSFKDGGEVGKVLFAVKKGDPDYMEVLITENPKVIEKAKEWAAANGYDRFRVATIDMKEAPDFKKTFADGGEVDSKISKLQAVVDSPLVPEALKEKARSEIASLTSKKQSMQTSVESTEEKSINSNDEKIKKLQAVVNSPLVPEPLKAKAQAEINSLLQGQKEEPKPVEKPVVVSKPVESDLKTVVNNAFDQLVPKPLMTPTKTQERILGSLIIAALQDSNFGDTAFSLAVRLDSGIQSKEDFYQSDLDTNDEKINDLGKKIASTAKWNAYDIVRVFKEVIKDLKVKLPKLYSALTFAANKTFDEYGFFNTDKEDRIKVKSITIDGLEGKTSIVSKFPKTFSSFKEAHNSLLPLWEDAVKEDTGFKGKFKVVFEDGNEYAGNLYISAIEDNLDLAFNKNVIGQHVKEVIEYELNADDVTADQKEEYKKWLQYDWGFFEPEPKIEKTTPKTQVAKPAEPKFTGKTKEEKRKSGLKTLAYYISKRMLDSVQFTVNGKKYTAGKSVIADGLYLKKTAKGDTIPEMKKGGTLSRDYVYIPNRFIKKVILEQDGAMKEYDGSDFLDGIYVKKSFFKDGVPNVKAPKVSRTQFEEDTYEFKDGGEIESKIIDEIKSSYNHGTEYFEGEIYGQKFKIRMNKNHPRNSSRNDDPTYHNLSLINVKYPSAEVHRINNMGKLQYQYDEIHDWNDAKEKIEDFFFEIKYSSEEYKDGGELKPSSLKGMYLTTPNGVIKRVQEVKKNDMLDGYFSLRTSNDGDIQWWENFDEAALKKLVSGKKHKGYSLSKSKPKSMAKGGEVSYVVQDEHTLGYVRDDMPKYVYILHASVLKGATNTTQHAAYNMISPDTKLRPATIKDFDEFRVMVPPDFNSKKPISKSMAKGGKINSKKFKEVMREFSEGTLTSHGKKVTDRKQAVAIAFSEASQ